MILRLTIAVAFFVLLSALSVPAQIAGGTFGPSFDDQNTIAGQFGTGGSPPGACSGVIDYSSGCAFGLFGP